MKNWIGIELDNGTKLCIGVGADNSLDVSYMTAESEVWNNDGFDAVIAGGNGMVFDTDNTLTKVDALELKSEL